MLSRLLTDDSAAGADWAGLKQRSWSWCGVKEGQFPDSRPMGFPLDRYRGNSILK